MSAHADHLDPDGFAGETRNEKYEIYEERTWEIYDPWNAKTIAVFHDQARAYEYLQFLNSDRAAE